MADVLSVSRQTINTWTKRRREDLEEETRRNILDLYLHAENTQEDIADKLNIPQQTVSRKIESFTQNANFSEMSKKLNLPSLYYTRWNLTHKDKDVKYFGIFPTIFMQHLLYYHTKPFDVVYDPFAGTGTTAEVCRQMYRRYYCSDLNVLPGTEEYIKQEDITNGIPLPGELPKIDLAFLDPPYWRQAQNKYSNSPKDLGNVSLETFYKLMNGLIYNLIGQNEENSNRHCPFVLSSIRTIL